MRAQHINPKLQTLLKKLLLQIGGKATIFFIFILQIIQIITVNIRLILVRRHIQKQKQSTHCRNTVTISYLNY